MGHGLDERWGGGVWLLGSGKIQFVAATDLRHISTIGEVGQGAGISGGSSDAKGGTANQGDEYVERCERGEAAIDGAVAAGETGAAQGTLDYGEDDGGGATPTGAKTKPTEWAKMSKSQRTRWRRGNKK